MTESNQEITQGRKSTWIIVLLIIGSSALSLLASSITCGLSTLFLGVINAYIWFSLEKTPREKFVQRGTLAGIVSAVAYGIFGSIIIPIVVLSSKDPPNFLLPLSLALLWLFSLIIYPLEGCITGYFKSRPRKAITRSRQVINKSEQVIIKTPVAQKDEGKEWNYSTKGEYKYYKRRAKNLYEATELLCKIGSIGDLTYFTAETPDGILGRDTLGFFTETPLKTKDLLVDQREAGAGTVKCKGLKGLGDDMTKNYVSVANSIIDGQYAPLVLFMICGKCGYEFPIETKAGELLRECYKCGTMNSGYRGKITVPIGNRMIQI